MSNGTTFTEGVDTPYDLASSDSNLSGQTYTGSSVYNSSHAISGAFNGIISENAGSWVSDANAYSAGTHNTSESTDGYAGEWIQVDIGESVTATSFEFYSRNVTNRDDNDAKKMRLFSSDDGTNWTQVYDWTGLTDTDWRNASSQVIPITLNQTVTARYFRLAINELIGSANYTQIAEFKIMGHNGYNLIAYTGHYAQIEFTESMAVNQLKLTPRNGGGGGAGEPIDFRLLVADNEDAWTSVLHVTENQIQSNWNKNGSDWATHEWSIPLETGQGKYWRLLINKISTGNKVQLTKMELMGGLTSGLTGSGTEPAALSIPGLETNVTNISSTFPVLFPGNTTGGNEAEAQKYGWVGSANADTLSLETTDETDTRTMDLHIWKITITL
jgi:hypothetical protein